MIFYYTIKPPTRGRGGGGGICSGPLNFLSRSNGLSGCPREFGPPNFGPPGPNFLGNMAPPLRKFGPLENIVYFIAINSEIVKLLLKPRS
jgi:hypothetical protein